MPTQFWLYFAITDIVKQYTSSTPHYTHHHTPHYKPNHIQYLTI